MPCLEGLEHRRTMTRSACRSAEFPGAFLPGTSHPALPMARRELGPMGSAGRCLLQISHTPLKSFSIYTAPHLWQGADLLQDGAGIEAFWLSTPPCSAPVDTPLPSRTITVNLELFLLSCSHALPNGWCQSEGSRGLGTP